MPIRETAKRTSQMRTKTAKTSANAAKQKKDAPKKVVAKKAKAQVKKAKPKKVDLVYSKPESVFEAWVKTSPLDAHPENTVVTYKVRKSAERLTWDEVIDGIYGEFEASVPSRYYPKAEVYRVFVIDGDGRFPVVAEDDEDEIARLKKSKEYVKFLVLPNAKYVVSNEFRLFSKMLDLGLATEEDGFDHEKMRELIETVRQFQLEEPWEDGEGV